VSHDRSPAGLCETVMEIDTDLIDDAVLTLSWLRLHDGVCAHGGL
jgi:hypothetical protein